jgi:hypothetical protein
MDPNKFASFDEKLRAMLNEYDACWFILTCIMRGVDLKLKWKFICFFY